jgi:hypothetical protein
VEALLTSLSFRRAAQLAAFAALAVAPAAHAAVPLTQIASDTFTNPESQHRTTVEPDTFSFGSTIVAAAQSGRYFDGGASGIVFGTSTNGGSTWTAGTLPGITNKNGNGGSFDRTTDPSVAYDAAHGVWLVSSLPLTDTSSGPLGSAVVVNRSTNGGVTFGTPVTVAAATGNSDYDKNWTACDNTASSPFYGHCYTTWDNFGDGDRLLVSTSTDGGLTWGPPLQTANGATGLGGQPVVQPNGTVVIPAANAQESAIIAFRSTNGGASWSSTVQIAAAIDHAQAGNLRSGPLPSAEIDAAGKVYVAWEDCRFRKGCKSDDIVLSSSADGVTWSAVSRVPIDAVSSGVDHFLPGLGVDASTSGANARLGLVYHFYRDARCRKACSLEVGYTQSVDGGSTWSTHTDVAGPFPLSQVPDSSQGKMVGDYFSTSWSGGRAFPAFMVASAPSGGFAFDQPMFTAAGGLTAAAGSFVNTSHGEHAIAGAASDHASARSAIRSR